MKKYTVMASRWFPVLMFFIVAVTNTSLVSAQNKLITGRVLDETSRQPLEGVNIIIEKSKSGTATKKMVRFP